MRVLVPLLVSLALASGAAAQSNSCSSPTAISGFGDFSFSTVGATSDGILITCPQPNNDVWLCWTAPSSGAVTADTCAGASFDTVIAVYAGCACPSANSSIACNDDSCGLGSRVQFAAVAGQQYLIRLGGYGSGSSGTGTLRLSCPACLPGVLPPVTVFMNPSFVETCTAAECEGTNTVGQLTALGCNVATFADFTVSSVQSIFAARRVLVIPEQEVASLLSSLSTSTRDGVRAAFQSGGRVLVFGTLSGRASEMLNLLLGTSLASTGNANGSSATLNSAAVSGTAFASAPPTLIGPNATYRVGTWPTSALVVYGTNASAWCAAASAGFGRAGFIAYDVYDPAQAAAMDWRMVMDRMLRNLASCPADLTGNGTVDGDDLARLLSRWGPVATGSEGDLNLDGNVNGADLGALLNAWGPCAG